MKNRKAFLLIILILIVAILACSNGETTTNQQSEPAQVQESSQSDESPDPTKIHEPTEITIPPTATMDLNIIKIGTYIVGTDIDPGIYRGEAGTGLFNSCYWARLEDLSGELDAIIANDNAEGQFYVEILETDYALETGCELVSLDSLQKPEGDFPTTIQTGTYIVGRDIQTGIYQGQAGEDFLDSCYWARLEDLTGELDSLIANDNAEGQFYVEVLETDYALETGCELVTLDSLPMPEGDLPTTIQAGTYIVGRDIQTGTYQGQAGEDFLDSCYWARLSDLTGSLDSIIANDNANGQYYIQVQDSDYALATGCELTRVGD